MGADSSSCAIVIFWLLSAQRWPKVCVVVVVLLVLALEMGAPKLSEEETSLIDELQKQVKEPKQVLDKLQRDRARRGADGLVLTPLPNNYQTTNKQLSNN